LRKVLEAGAAEKAKATSEHFAFFLNKFFSMCAQMRFDTYMSMKNCVISSSFLVFGSFKKHLFILTASNNWFTGEIKSLIPKGQKIPNCPTNKHT